MSAVVPAAPGFLPRPLPRLLSIVTPAYDEAENLPELWARLDAVVARLEIAWEWIVVDDASTDATAAVLADLAALHPCVRPVRRTRRRGSHAAILRGCREARGDAALVLAADLQDPPEALPLLLAQWQHGADVVWAARPRATARQARLGPLYYWLMRNVAGLHDMPAHGADLVLIDGSVLRALRRPRRRTTSVLALIAALGRSQVSIPSAREPRRRGRSGWTSAGRARLGITSLAEFATARVLGSFDRP